PVRTAPSATPTAAPASVTSSLQRTIKVVRYGNAREGEVLPGPPINLNLATKARRKAEQLEDQAVPDQPAGPIRHQHGRESGLRSVLRVHDRDAHLGQAD